MEMKHIIMEIYCDYQKNKNKVQNCKGLCIECFSNSCKYLSYTYCPNEIAYSSQSGIVEEVNHYIGFGGEMEPDEYNKLQSVKLKSKWKEICLKKINETYSEYMEYYRDTVNDDK